MRSEDERLAGLAAAVRSSPHNLVSRRALDEIESRHLPESVALARMLPDGPARLVDVGSGGGFPGIVIAVIRDDLEVTLVEATGKKARFLERTASELDVDVTVVNRRMEEAVELRGCFQLATARAVAPLQRLIPWTIPLLSPGGRLYAVKGERWAEELEEARAQLRATGAEVVATPERPTSGAGVTESGPRVVIIAAPEAP